MTPDIPLRPLAFLKELFHDSAMGSLLEQAKRRFIARLLSSGRFKNESEVVCEARRRMKLEEMDFLNPPPLTPAKVEAIYGSEDSQADQVGRGAFNAVCASAEKGTTR